MLELRRRIATIVAADVVGFARLVSAAEEEVFERLWALQKELIEPAVAVHDGRIVKTMGDGILVEFANPEAAIRAAQTVQEGVTERESDLPEDRRIRFRIGINHGSVLVDGDDILGDVVNIAARLETLAPPGGICVSRSVRDMVQDQDGLTLSSQGVQYVRNIPTPVEVWQVHTGVVTEGPIVQHQRADRPAVLVLPFENLTRLEEDDFLADGITDDTISALSRFRALFVIARGTAFTYKGRAQDIRQIAKDTGVRYVVTGSVRRGGPRLRVSAQLTEAETGEVIWSDKYDRDLEDIFALQDDITRCVVTGITPEIGAHERQISRQKPTENLTAWEMCQRGLSEIDQRTNLSVRNAFELFHKAIAADPSYALPHALLGRLHAVRVYSGRSQDLVEDVKNGMFHAMRAIELDDRLELGHLALAQLLLIQKREDEARASLARAKALNDNDSFVYSAQTFINLFQDEPDTEEMEKAGLEAVRLSPNDPLAWSYHWMLVMAVWLRDGELGENVRHYLDPASRLPGAEAFVHVAVGVVAVKRDDMEAARNAVEAILQVRPEMTLKIVRHAFHFPKWPELVAGVEPQLAVLKELGLPEG